jgi:uncharacterized protein
MSPRILDRLFDFGSHLAARESGAGPERRLSMLWHGGEPLLMGPEFFERVHTHTQALAERGVAVRHRMQSNLLAWNDELAAVLAPLLRGGGLSSSAEPLGMSRRRLPGGASYMGRWLEQLEAVRGAGFHVGLVCVVDGVIAQRPRDTYYYFKNLVGDGGVRFNPLYPPRRGSAVAAPYRLGPDVWGRFLAELWDVWLEDGRTLRVEPFVGWEQSARGETGKAACDMSGRCGSRFFGISPAGDVHACGRAMDAGTLCYGNLLTDSFDEILASPSRTGLVGRTEELRRGACGDCPWWRLCHGGCGVQAWQHGGEVSDPSAWCAGRKVFFGHAFGESLAWEAHG